MARTRLGQVVRGMTRRSGGRGTVLAAAILGLVLFGWAGIASALSFGNLQVQSALNQPFHAFVDLDGLDAASAASVSMASPSDFSELGVTRTSIADRINIQTRADNAGHRLRVVFTTEKPVSDPMLDFVIRVASNSGTALHEYTALLDPPSGYASTPVANAAAPQSSSVYAGSMDDARSDAASAGQGRILPPIPHHHQRGYQGGRYHVQPGDTLYSIAAHRTPHGSSVWQTAWAIYQANPKAFGGGPSVLLKGATLNMPSAARIRDVSAQRAHSKFDLANNSAPSGTGTASASADDRSVTRQSASGEMPPSPAALDKQGATQSQATSGTPDIKSADAATTFGTLVPPSNTPWQPSGAGTTSQATTGTPAATPSGASSSASAASTGAGAVSSSGAPAATGTATATKATTPAATPLSPAVSQTTSSSGPGLLRPRNLILLLVLLITVFLLMRMRQQRAKAEDTQASVAPRSGFGGARRRATAKAGQDRNDDRVAIRTSPTGAPAATPASPSGPDAPLGPAEPAWLVGASAVPRPARSAGRPASEADEATASPSQAGSADTAMPTNEGAERPESREAVPPAATRPGTPAIDAAPRAGARPETPPRPQAAESASPAANQPVDTDGVRPAAPRGVSAASSPQAGSSETTSPLSDPRPQDAPDHSDLEFEPSEIEPKPRAHDRGRLDNALDFDDAPVGARPAIGTDDADWLQPAPVERHDEESDASAGQTAAAKDEDGAIANNQPYGLEMIDPGEFDLHDPDAEQPHDVEQSDEDSLQIRLDLARMYIDMDDATAARELAEDVAARGDEDQRATAKRLLEEIGSR